MGNSRLFAARFFEIYEKHVFWSSKTLILSISGPRNLLETIPRATSDRMVSVPFDFVSSNGKERAKVRKRSAILDFSRKLFLENPWGDPGVPILLID